MGLHFLSAKINNKISVIYCWCGIFLDMLIKVQAGEGFFGETNSEVGIFLGMKYGPTPPLSLKYMSDVSGKQYYLIFTLIVTIINIISIS